MPRCAMTARDAYLKLFDAINAKRGYGVALNPWAWVYEFERCHGEGTKPILFRGDMVRALLKDVKSQTRRVVSASNSLADQEPLCKAEWAVATKHLYGNRAYSDPDMHSAHIWLPATARRLIIVEPRIQAGDLLWVRENLTRPDGDPWLYAADRMPVMVDKADESAMLIWAHHKEQDYCPSIHMPRWASRITLRITAVRCERVCDISETDAIAEGVRETEFWREAS